MKWRKPVLGLLGMLSVITADIVSAHSWHGSRIGVSVVYGGPIGWVGYYPRYYGWYSYPPVAVVPAPLVVESSPFVYIEKGANGSSSSTPPDYWYYCRNPRGYYPYVKECPGGWQEVAPLPDRP